MRYFVIKNGGDTLIWDSVDEQMYSSEDGVDFSKVKSNLIGISKFCPSAEVIKKTDTKPKGI